MRINDSKITKNANSCAIVGAGLIGLEMLEAFKKRGSLTDREQEKVREKQVVMVIIMMPWMLH